MKNEIIYLGRYFKYKNKRSNKIKIDSCIMLNFEI